MAWISMGENLKTSAKGNLGCYELQRHEQWFSKDCPKLSDERKLDNLQWLQEPIQMDDDNLNNITCDNIHNKNILLQVYTTNLKIKINELETSSKNQNIRLVWRDI
jgi:hypothetical protein